MKDTLYYIVSALVENPTKVEIQENEEDGIVLFTISVAPEDMGKIIGKEGKVIRSIRNIMKILAMKQNKKIQIQLSDDSPQ